MQHFKYRTAISLVSILLLFAAQSAFAKEGESEVKTSLQQKTIVKTEVLQKPQTATKEIINFDAEITSTPQVSSGYNYEVSDKNHIFIGKPKKRKSHFTSERERFNYRMDIPPLEPAVAVGFKSNF